MLLEWGKVRNWDEISRILSVLEFEYLDTIYFGNLNVYLAIYPCPCLFGKLFLYGKKNDKNIYRMKWA